MVLSFPSMVLETGFRIVIERNHFKRALLATRDEHANTNQALDARIGQVFLRNVAPAEKVHSDTRIMLAQAVLHDIQNVTFR